MGELNPERHQYFRSIASPVPTDDLILAPYARGDSLTAILRRPGEGDLTDSHVLWTSQQHSADVPTPAVSGKRIFVCRDQNLAVCLDADSGERIWINLLEKSSKKFSSSPVVAGGNVYFTREDGRTFVVADSTEFELLETNDLAEQVVATPVFVDGRIYLRTYENLYCIAEAADE